MEVRCTEKEEERAKLLAEKVKEVVKSVKGAQVRCPLLRLKIKLTGLPVGVAVSEVSEAVARAGGGNSEEIRVGPLRTLASGVVSTVVECPKRVALRTAGAAGLTLG